MTPGPNPGCQPQTPDMEINVTKLATALFGAAVALPLAIASYAAHAAPLGAGGPHDAAQGLPSAVTQIHARMHSRCYLHLKHPSLACHKHVRRGNRWIMQVCSPADCESITVKGGKRSKSKVYGD